MAFSRFHNCDLQVHTPADSNHQYGNVGGREPSLQFAKTLVEAHANAGVEIIAVTDHNRVDWYPVLNEAGEEFGVSVFPGVEISVNGCHLIALWERSKDGHLLAERFVESLWPPGEPRFAENGDPRPVTEGQVLEVARRAASHQALVIAPHSTAKGMGLFARGVCRNHVEIAQSGIVLGFDVSGSKSADVLGNPRRVFGDSQPSWFISGDVRSINQVGKRTTYLKLSPEPTLEGIRQAFLMPDTRIRLPQALESGWNHVLSIQFLESPKPSWPRLESIEIEGGFHSGLSTGLAPGLNAIIGGKGTGKSTLIEILRYVIDGGVPLVQDGQANRRANFQANAEATIGIVDHQHEPYTIHRSGDETQARLLRDGRETGVDVRRRFDVTVFGQRELQELANREELLREFVASQAGPEWESATKEETSLVSSLRSADTELRQVELDIDQLQEYVEELKDIDERLLRAQDKGVDKLVKDSNVLAELEHAIAEVLEWPSKVSTAADTLEKTLPAPVPICHRLLPDGLRGCATKLEVVVGRIIEELRSSIESTTRDVEELTTKWNKARLDERHRIQSELAEAGIANPEELGVLQVRRAELASLVDNQAESVKRKEELASQRKSKLILLAEIRRRKSRLTESASRELTNRVGDRVRVRTDPMADRTQLVALFEEHLHGQSVRKTQLEHLAGFAPSVIADAIFAGTRALEALGCTPSLAAKLAQLPPFVARSCEECDIPDYVTVEINLGGEIAENWTSIKEVSPGQRATALLALALASGNSPLIIDQPEDDLDNRYIYDEVVKVLRAVCKSRQVVVATHNANVAVLGDAEMILALDADSGRGRVLATGGLEIPIVAETARKILEGGDEAFRARHRRYLASEAHQRKQ